MIPCKQCGTRLKLEMTSSQRCIICQEVLDEALRKGKAVGMLISAVKRREDDVYKGLSGELGDLDKRDVFWYSSCYSSLTQVSRTSPVLQKPPMTLMKSSPDSWKRRLRQDHLVEALSQWTGRNASGKWSVVVLISHEKQLGKLDCFPQNC